MADKIFFGLLLAAFITAVHCGEWCTDKSYDWFDSDDTFYCDQGCCGDSYDRHCCIDGEVGMIVGIVIGCLVLLAIIVSIIVAIFCCRRRKARQGQVVGGVTTVNTVPVAGQPYSVTTTQVGYSAGYPQMPQTVVGTYPPPPPAGNVGMYPPPAGNGGAYPPPAPAGNQQFAQPPPSYDSVQPK